MRTCRACGGSYRRGTLALVVSRGRVVRARVCPTCADRGVLVVAEVVAPKLVTKVVRGDAVEAAIARLSTYRKMSATAFDEANGFPNASSTRASLAGRLEGIDTAIETLKQIAEGR